MKTVTIGGEIFVPVSRASEILGYSRDYVGQLCRVGTFSCKRSGGQWFVLEKDVSSRSSHKKITEEKDSKKEKDPAEKEQGPGTPPALHKVKVGTVRNDSIFFDGEEYVTSARAKDLTGYAQDYIGELARAGAVSARKVGKHWFIAKESLLKHKKEKDALLAHVQAESAGFSGGGFVDVSPPQKMNFSARYVAENVPPMPMLRADVSPTAVASQDAHEEVQVLKTRLAPVAPQVFRYFPQVAEGSYKVPVKKVLATPEVSAHAINKALNNISDRRFPVKEFSKVSYSEKEYLYTTAHVAKKRISSGVHAFLKGISMTFFVISLVLFSVYAIRTFPGLLTVSDQVLLYEQVSNILPGNTFEYRSE